MKVRVLAVLGVAVLLAALISTLPAVREPAHWIWASRRDQPADYAAYLASWPAGRHASQAKGRHDERSWATAQSINTQEALERYLRDHPEGAHVTGALRGIDRHRFLEARKENTVISCQRYLDAQPTGQFVAEAESIRAALLVDPAPYLAAQAAGTGEAYEDFLAKYPGHRSGHEAQTALQDIDGRDIVDLLNRGTIRVKTTGAGIEQVTLEITRLARHPVTVRIPVGTYFLCRGSAQNMVATEEGSVALTDDAPRTVGVSAACTDRTKDIPSDDERFDVRRAPRQRELQQLIPVLQRGGVTSAVRQAAVWIVTDNANYEELGILVSRPVFMPFGGTRVIDEPDAAMAMKLCDDAGIDVTQKAIWLDRKEIVKGLQDESLRQWLQQRGRK